MANIILINDQDQEQTLTGVSKLVTRSTDGDVEFSVGGGGGAVSGGKTIIYALPGGPGGGRRRPYRPAGLQCRRKRRLFGGDLSGV